MSKFLKEQLERIHRLNYGKKMLTEQNLIDKILNKVDGEEKKVDDPKKADLVSDDIQQFYNSLKTASDNGGISQQERGTMSFQKEVESMQIGLVLLGYQLPKFGIDGLFGPETGSAVLKFKEDHTLNESVSNLRNTLHSLGYSEKGSELTSGGEVSNELSSIVSQILTDFKSIAPNVKIMVTGGNDKYHQSVGYNSTHKTGNAIDVTINPYNSTTSQAFLSLLKKYQSKNPELKFIDEYQNPSSAATGGHFHLQLGGGDSVNKTTPQMINADPQMLNTLIEQLKLRGVNSKDLIQHIDAVNSGGVGFTDLDMNSNDGYSKYSEICQRFINKRQPNPLGITGVMMAAAARNTYMRLHKYVPPELALSQLALEGGIGNGDVNSRPIRTKNPFNVGNTDNGSNQNMGQVEAGIQAYYDLIGRRYLGNGRTAADLVNNFVDHNRDRYASSQSYEAGLNKLIPQINGISQSVVGQS